MSIQLQINQLNPLPQALEGAERLPVDLNTGAGYTTYYATPTQLGGVVPQNAAELAAGVIPTTLTYPPLNILRYGGDNTGTTDNSTPFASLVSVMLQSGGGTAYLPPGTYNLASSVTASLEPSTSPPTATSYGLHFIGWGVTIHYTGNGFAFDMTSTNADALATTPILDYQGINVIGTSAGLGAFRQTDTGQALYLNCRAYNFTSGTGFTQRNVALYSENNTYINCRVIDCEAGMQFLFSGGDSSMSRTTVQNFMGAGISGYWFFMQTGAVLYDSTFTNICGNFTGLAIFGIQADMTDSIIDGIKTEWNGNPNGYAQAIIRLIDYPAPSSAERRPVLLNVGIYATYGSQMAIWGGGSSLTSQFVLPGPESASNTQPFSNAGPITATFGQSTFYEPALGAQALRNVATSGSSLYTASISGCTAAVSGRMVMLRTGQFAKIFAYDSLIGTSNSTSMTLTITNPELIPTIGFTVSVPCIVTNNGATASPAIASFATASTYYSTTFTGVSPAGSTSATLASNWTGTTGVYLGVFSTTDSETRPVNLTNGAATCTWTVPLSSAANTGFALQCCVVTFSLATAFNTYSSTGFTASGSKGLSVGAVISYPLIN